MFSIKRVAGRHEYAVFVCSRDEEKFDESCVLEKLNELREVYSFELYGWDKFSVQSGYFEHVIVLYQNLKNKKKKYFEQFKSFSIS